MDTITTTTTTPTTTTPTTVKTPPEDPEPVNSTRTQPAKPISYTNGVLKLRQPFAIVPHGPPSSQEGGPWRECLKNHAAAMGGHAVDGCGEFMPSPSLSSLLCSACGCHRNFHRKDDSPHAPAHAPPHTQVTEYQPLHRHHAPPQLTHAPPQPSHAPTPRSPNSASPPPISSTYYPSAPHMLLALSTNPSPNPNNNPNPNVNSSGRKRFRTRFTQVQKDKMFEFAEKLGWKMQRRDEDVINGFCNSIGVEKGVFKVWMHNNKNTLGKRELSTSGVNGIDLDNVPSGGNEYRNGNPGSNGDDVRGTNGSSSSS